MEFKVISVEVLEVVQQAKVVHGDVVCGVARGQHLDAIGVGIIAERVDEFAAAFRDEVEAIARAERRHERLLAFLVRQAEVEVEDRERESCWCCCCRGGSWLCV